MYLSPDPQLRTMPESLPFSTGATPVEKIGCRDVSRQTSVDMEIIDCTCFEIMVCRMERTVCRHVVLLGE